TTSAPEQSRWMGRGPSMLKVPGKGRVKAFYIDRTEVSWGDYVAMLTFFERDVMTTHTEHPTHGVKLPFDEAEEYCAWAGKRLLTFAEWQRVVGPNPARSMGEEPEPVDARPPNELGIFGLENGLMEWTQTDSAMAGYKLIGGLDMDPPALPVDGNVMGVRCAADADKVPRPSASNPAP
ncbi:MAG: SUMF1/EgtB/PvdO family nonheme iron enzyme, partial [Myxococcales bacterium]|nr:SUMF1/EgtB/PvdO family nonheme iron enzyme [Myxococcales bacterium]